MAAMSERPEAVFSKSPANQPSETGDSIYPAVNNITYLKKQTNGNMNATAPTHSGHLRTIRDHNRGSILRCIDSNPSISRSEITSRVGLTDAAVSRITRELIDAGLVNEGEEIIDNTRPGRRQVGLSINPDGAFILSACLTLFEKRLSLINIAGDVVAKTDLSDLTKFSSDAIVGELGKRARTLIANARVPKARLLGFGVVAAGSIDHGLGLLKAGSIEKLIGLPLRPLIENEFKIPVRLENVGHALNVAESRNNPAAERRSTVLLVHIAMGLGASLVIDGRPHRSDQDERMIGHILVPGASDPCLCGARGCLNTLVSGFAILNRLSGSVITTRSSAPSAAHYDPRALSKTIARANKEERALQALFHEAGLVLGQNLFAVSAAVSPDQIMLAGPVPQVASFASGVMHGMSVNYGRTRLRPPPLHVSHIDYARATELFALDEFLFNLPLRMKQILAG